jgi:hypothetical protein
MTRASFGIDEITYHAMNRLDRQAWSDRLRTKHLPDYGKRNKLLNLPDGIYFGLDEATYHALPRLSAHGMGDLLRGPHIFWPKSWLCPAPVRDVTPAMALGTAYHKRILEGSSAFYAAYAPRFDASDASMCPQDAVVTCDDFRNFLTNVPGAKRTGNRAELIGRVKYYAPAQPIADTYRLAYEAANTGKTFLSRNDIKTIELAADTVARSTDAQTALADSFAEVSILWTWLGVPMRSRLDALGINNIIDLKTFTGNSDASMLETLNRLTMRDFASQQAVYLQAVAAGRVLARGGHVHVLDDSPAPSDAWLAKFAAGQTNSFTWLMWQKFPEKRLHIETLAGDALHETVLINLAQPHTALAIYKHCLATYGTDGQPWPASWLANGGRIIGGPGTVYDKPPAPRGWLARFNQWMLKKMIECHA